MYRYIYPMLCYCGNIYLFYYLCHNFITISWQQYFLKLNYDRNNFSV